MRAASREQSRWSHIYCQYTVIGLLDFMSVIRLGFILALSNEICHPSPRSFLPRRLSKLFLRHEPLKGKIAIGDDYHYDSRCSMEQGPSRRTTLGEPRLSRLVQNNEYPRSSGRKPSLASWGPLGCSHDDNMDLDAMIRPCCHTSTQIRIFHKDFNRKQM